MGTCARKLERAPYQPECLAMLMQRRGCSGFAPVSKRVHGERHARLVVVHRRERSWSPRWRSRATDLYKARNTLTHRILGPQSNGTIELDISGMKDGDVAGLALLRHLSAYIAVKKSGGTAKLTMVNGLTMDSSWNTTSTGTEAASADVTGTTVWLRLDADIRPGSGRQGKFSYSTDGTTFTALGPAYTMNNSWEFFMGYRYGIFNFATAATGGAVTVKSFTLATP